MKGVDVVNIGGKNQDARYISVTRTGEKKDWIYQFETLSGKIVRAKWVKTETFIDDSFGSVYVHKYQVNFYDEIESPRNITKK